jgi:hypothetical protein
VISNANVTGSGFAAEAGVRKSIFSVGICRSSRKKDDSQGQGSVSQALHFEHGAILRKRVLLVAMSDWDSGGRRRTKDDACPTISMNQIPGLCSEFAKPLDAVMTWQGRRRL